MTQEVHFAENKMEGTHTWEFYVEVEFDLFCQLYAL